MANTKETGKLINNTADILSKDPQLLDEFKSNPSAAIGKVLKHESNADISSETKAEMEKAVATHKEGANFASLLGSLGGMFGKDHGEAVAEHEAQGNPLDKLGDVLGGIKGKGANVLGSLGSFFGDKVGDVKEGIGGLVGKFFHKS